MSAEEYHAVTPKNRRRAARHKASGTVLLDGIEHPLVDWSSSGFLASGYRGEHISGDRLTAQFSLDIDEDPYVFHCKIFIVRVDRGSSNIAGIFIEMQAKDRLKIVQHLG